MFIALFLVAWNVVLVCLFRIHWSRHCWINMISFAAPVMQMSFGCWLCLCCLNSMLIYFIQLVSLANYSFKAPSISSVHSGIYFFTNPILPRYDMGLATYNISCFRFIWTLMYVLSMNGITCVTFRRLSRSVHCSMFQLISQKSLVWVGPSVYQVFV